MEMNNDYSNCKPGRIVNSAQCSKPLESVCMRLETNIDGLETELHGLYSRLDTVLAKGPGEPPPNVPQPLEGSSAAVCKFAQLNERVLALTYAVRNCVARLEV